MPNPLRRSRTRPGLRRCVGGNPHRSCVPAFLTDELAYLVSEMAAIHSENRRDWESGSATTRLARAELQFRHDRLEEIRAVLQSIYCLEQQPRIPAKGTIVVR